MKRPVTLGAELLKTLSKKMEEDDIDKSLKMRIVQETLHDIFKDQENKEYKLRRNPKARLVLHALCLHENSSGKVRKPQKLSNAFQLCSLF